jgi:signal transduction histidine kinase
MSGAGSRPAPQLASQFTSQSNPGATAKARSPLAHLLHALNQPLTGLQCSLELTVAGPQPTNHYVRALRESLELTGRMRILVEAIREVADAQSSDAEELEPLPLDQLLLSTAAELLPVAEAKKVRLVFGNHLPGSLAEENFAPENQAALRVRADRRFLATLLFRFLESALSLAQEGTDLRIVATAEPAHSSWGHATLAVSWTPGPPLEHSPFSRPEVGLLVAQAGWERLGAEWIYAQVETTDTCTIRLPLASTCAAL